MNITKYILFSMIIGLLAFTSCTESYAPGKNITVVEEQIPDVPEVDALLRFINNSGDYINSDKFPSLVSADDVYDNLQKYYIIDIRSAEDYKAGHINGAMNIQTNKLMVYLDENVAPSIYQKLVVVCTNGQASAYVTTVLRMIGYSNIYSLSYGMSSWNKTLDKWTPNLSSKYISKLETKTNLTEGMFPYPVINTGEHCGAEIMESRALTLLNTPFQKLKISADRVFKNPEDFYIINYWPKERYDIGHIPGAYQYTPRKDISLNTLLNTIPSDKKVLVYGYTGQSSSAIAAYLRILGYNAFTMPFGANSFMYNTLKLRNWHAFIGADKLNDYPLVKGENPTDKAFEKDINTRVKKKDAAPKKVIRRKKKEVEGGCS